MVIHLTSPDAIDICLLKPAHEFSFHRLAQNWAGMIINALTLFPTRLATSVDNSRRLTALSLNVIKTRCISGQGHKCPAGSSWVKWRSSRIVKIWHCYQYLHIGIYKVCKSPEKERLKALLVAMADKTLGIYSLESFFSTMRLTCRDTISSQTCFRQNC